MLTAKTPRCVSQAFRVYTLQYFWRMWRFLTVRSMDDESDSTSWRAVSDHCQWKRVKENALTHYKVNAGEQRQKRISSPGLWSRCGRGHSDGRGILFVL